MKKNIKEIIYNVVLVINLILLVAFAFLYKHYKDRGIKIEAYYNEVFGDIDKRVADYLNLISELKSENIQLSSDLEAYKKAIDEVNEERKAINDKAEEKAKADEELWNSLSDAQKDAITRGKERAKITNYLLLNNAEYADLYVYMRDLSDKGLVELSKSEYQKYKEAKTRMIELEAEAKTILESAESEE